MRMHLESPSERRLLVDDLVRDLARGAADVGPNPTPWPGLTLFRHDGPTPPRTDDVRFLSIYLVAQGRARVRVGIDEYVCGPNSYFVMTRDMRLQTEVLTASPARPFLALVLQLDPTIVHRMLSEMRVRSSSAPDPGAADGPSPLVSRIDPRLDGAVVRFLEAVASDVDRAVLAPIHLQEVIYRVLRTDRCATLVGAAVQETETHPVGAAIAFMQADLSRQVTVPELAEVVAMSPSAFAHLFKSITGVSPYQFGKRLRLDRARTMLVEDGTSVSEAAASVGYSSLSHFINEFKRQFGVTPGCYVSTQRETIVRSIIASTPDLGGRDLRSPTSDG